MRGKHGPCAGNQTVDNRPTGLALTVCPFQLLKQLSNCHFRTTGSILALLSTLAETGLCQGSFTWSCIGWPELMSFSQFGLSSNFRTLLMDVWLYPAQWVLSSVLSLRKTTVLVWLCVHILSTHPSWSISSRNDLVEVSPSQSVTKEIERWVLDILVPPTHIYSLRCHASAVRY